MSRSNPLPDFPGNLLEFIRMFPDEAACAVWLEQVRWPDGFVCHFCGVQGEPYRHANRPRVLECRSCKRQTTLTAHSVLHRTKVPLQSWFAAAYLVATTTPGISALQVQRQVGIGRYETAFQMMHKLRSAMVRPDRDKIGSEWPVELDIAYVGGKHKGGVQGKTDKAPVILAVEVKEGKPPKPGSKKKEGPSIYAGRLRARKIPNKKPETVLKFVQEWIAPGAVIVTDGGVEYNLLTGASYVHQGVPMRKDPDKIDAWLPLIHLIIGNLKAWINGTFHGIGKKHMPAYLNEFTFRFNRRFWRPVSFRSLFGIGAHQEGPTYRGLYDADWIHRENPTLVDWI